MVNNISGNIYINISGNIYLLNNNRYHLQEASTKEIKFQNHILF